MLRQLLLPLLALTLLATEAASAQTTPPAARKQGRMLTARERRAQEAAARQLAVAQAAPAANQPTASSTTWSGWSNDPLPFTPELATAHRATGYNVSVAPGMPINQVGHGVSTDYNGRPLVPAVASTTLPSVR